ncbi:MAG TPA: nuclear transport factor 2 family protein [Flavisolibacter sp.]|nr:nuclear transport factor 2 family protein [Flavisolibacter sp.]
MKKFFLSIMCLVALNSFSQSKDEKQILNILSTQSAAWNRGDIEGFMQTYWKHDSLMFIGKNGIKWGWEATLNNYKKSYPNADAMGQLSFDIITIKKLSSKYHYVVGKWMLKRTIGDLSGHFDLLLRKINGQWVIVSDHSS